MTIKEELEICDLLGVSVECQKKSVKFIDDLIFRIDYLPENFVQYKKHLPRLRKLLEEIR